MRGEGEPGFLFFSSLFSYLLLVWETNKKTKNKHEPWWWCSFLNRENERDRKQVSNSISDRNEVKNEKRENKEMREKLSLHKKGDGKHEHTFNWTFSSSSFDPKEVQDIFFSCSWKFSVHAEANKSSRKREREIKTDQRYTESRVEYQDDHHYYIKEKEKDV